MTKNITRWPYGFGAQTAEEEKQIKDFLGIDPPGKDINTYLSGLNKSQLAEWEKYWFIKWTNLKRSDLVNFTWNLYNKYLALTSKAQVTLKPAPSIIPEETRAYWMTKGYNASDAQKIADWIKTNQKTPTQEKINSIIGLPEIVKVWRELQTNISKNDWIAAAGSALSLLSAKATPAEQNIMMGEISIGGITPTAFLKDPKGIAKAFASLDATNAGKVIDVWKKTTAGQALVGNLISTAIKNQGISWITKALPWIGGVITIMGTTTFVEFLYEESLQTAGMGVYIAISNKNWSAAKEALGKAKSILAAANFVYNYLGWIAPYSFNVFRNYAKATQAQYEVYDKVITAQGGVISDPSASGKVFNLAEANANIANGTSPSVDKMIAGVLEEPSRIIKIRSVTDGDTIKAILPNESIESTIRLLGIDSPEKGATGYKQSSAWLNSKLLGAAVTLLIDPANAKDSYGRALAVVIKDGVNINLESVKQGWSTYFPYQGNIYVNENEFMLAESSAKAANLGIWALTGAGVTTPAQPVAPEEPTAPTAPTEKAKITEKDFFAEMKKFYSGRMYMSKKELAALLEKYDTTGIKAFIDEVLAYYTGRAYLSKYELVDLGAKHGFDISGLA